MQYREFFWKNLEHAYANQDNAAYTIARRRQENARQAKIDQIIVATVLIVGTLVLSFAATVAIF